MPKPFAEHPGSGMHTHLSLFEGDANAFHEAGAPYQLSKTGRQFIAGLLHHGAEITAVTNQWVNSYKRLWGGGEAPAHLTWGHNNRSALVRVPMYKPNKGNQQPGRGALASTPRATPTSPSRCCSPPGLKGIEEGYELPPETEDDVWSLTDAERRAMGIKPLPPVARTRRSTSWRAASSSPRPSASTSSSSSCATSGQEWDDYRHQVTPFELDRYLPRL